jgi:hypothetical protein
VRRLCLVSLLLLAGAGLADEPSPVPEEARTLMKEGLERELPSPTPRGPPQWPSATPAPKDPKEVAPGQQKKDKDTLGERLRNEASLRARAAAEERRAAPENNQGPGQSRTRAAKGEGPKPPRPPKP